MSGASADRAQPPFNRELRLPQRFLCGILTHYPWNWGFEMFEYSDPSGTNLLSRFRAISEWRSILEQEYMDGAKQLGSAFTWIDAIMDVPDDKRAIADIEWRAFPILAPGTPEQIDANRSLQEEYVEWAVFRDGAGQIDEIVFVTEFREYFGVLAGVSPTGIQTAIEELNPGAVPSTEELYGVSSVTGMSRRERELRFLDHLGSNPWNTGEKGILAMTTRVNSIPALFGLAAPCGIVNDAVPADQVCQTPFCVPGRQSDPQICTICQRAARDNRSFSLVDPVGIFISRIEGGVWRIGGTQIAINDPISNEGRWTISRNGRRASLKVGGAERLTLDGDEIETGTQVSEKLIVAATVASALDADLPEWARRGKEDLERRAERTEGV
ncbi:MAG: hypothetical protein AAFU80_21525 [Pseudomonadota bacterium]